MRIESDFIGEVQIHKNALFGIHSKRATLNFPDHTPFHIEWYKAIGLVKLACYQTYNDYKIALTKKYKQSDIPFSLIHDEIIQSLIQSAKEVSEGKYFESFIIPAIQGGAGTSINMNCNEIITNASLISLGHNPGEYSKIDPIEQANIFQSTNDVIPTSLKLCIIQLLGKLEESINQLRIEIESVENQHHNSIRIGYTQMQEAVPSSYGRLFSTYNDALSRDWWRVSKCFERIKTINLGGSAIGTGITVPQFFIMEVVQKLQKLTGLPITRAENLSDSTANLDSFVEVHAILKAHAVNLEKMNNDIRLLASDLSHKEMTIPNMQVGSSIMPGKVNPVIPEFIISSSHKIYANDQLITSLSALGTLELNAYLPLIGHSIIDSIKLLIASNNTFKSNLIKGLIIDSHKAEVKLYDSGAISTALIPYIGYHKASELSKYMKENNINIFEANKKLNIIEPEKLQIILSPKNLLKEGFTLNDIIS